MNRPTIGLKKVSPIPLRSIRYWLKEIPNDYVFDLCSSDNHPGAVYFHHMLKDSLGDLTLMMPERYQKPPIKVEYVENPYANIINVLTCEHPVYKRSDKLHNAMVVLQEFDVDEDLFRVYVTAGMFSDIMDFVDENEAPEDPDPVKEWHLIADWIVDFIVDKAA